MTMKNIRSLVLIFVLLVICNLSFGQSFIRIPYTHPEDINTKSEKWVKVASNVYGYSIYDTLAEYTPFNTVIFDDGKNKMITYANTENSATSSRVYSGIHNFLLDAYGPPNWNQNFIPEYIGRNPTNAELAVAIKNGHAQIVERWRVKDHQIILIWTKATGISLVFDYHQDL